MSRRVFARGDIVAVDLNPTIGREIGTPGGVSRPALVLSKAEFNALGMVFVAPITQGAELARVHGFAASLVGAGTKTQGAVVVNMARMLDLEARSARFIERAPEFVVDDALARLQAILD